MKGKLIWSMMQMFMPIMMLGLMAGMVGGIMSGPEKEESLSPAS